MNLDVSKYDLLAPHLQRMVCDLIVAELKTLKPQKFKYIKPDDIDVTQDIREVFDLDSLDLLRCAGAVATLFNIYDNGLEDVLLAKRSIAHWSELAATSRQEGSKDLSFATSGTMGKPRVFRHDWTWLLQETKAWANKLKHVERVVACVPSHHIYGAIWTCILPEVLQVPVISITVEKLKKDALHDGDLLVTVPPHWEYFAATACNAANSSSLIERDTARNIIGVSSTAALNPSTRQRLIEVCGLSEMWQIYGSTETAGIAFANTSTGVYKWLDFISSHSSQSILRTTPNGDIVTQSIHDNINIIDESSFTVVSRTDDIVKIGGHRVSLNAVQAAIKEHPKVMDCLARLDISNGRLKALIVPQANVYAGTADNDDLITELDVFFSSRLAAYQLPRTWVIAATLPTNSLGKYVDWV